MHQQNNSQSVLYDPSERPALSLLCGVLKLQTLLLLVLVRNDTKRSRIIAMADSEVDMRYQLDLSHMEDLPINSLGRRVRTRLYFTSESHLHTLLNVLR